MKSNAELEQCVWEVGNGEVGHGLEQIERHVGDLAGVLVAVRFRKSTDDHVGVSYRLDLVHVVLVEYRVKCSEGEDDNVRNARIQRQRYAKNNVIGNGCSKNKVIGDVINGSFLYGTMVQLII